jgi:hypothetical protein
VAEWLKAPVLKSAHHCLSSPPTRFYFPEASVFPRS